MTPTPTPTGHPSNPPGGAPRSVYLALLLAGLAVALLVVTTAPGSSSGASRKNQRRGAAEWIWSGAVTTSSAQIKVRTAAGADRSRLVVGMQPDLAGGDRHSAGPANPSGVIDFELTSLEPGTTYYYGLEVDGQLGSLRGSFQTFERGPHSFTFAMSACAKTGSSSRVFDTIRRHEPLFFLHLGDLHYENIARDDPSAYRAAFDRVLGSPRQSALYRDVPIVYIWDDHDFGGDNSDRLNPGRRAVRQIYQEVVPHYPLVAGEGDVPIYHAFSVGRVRFIVTDSRSERSPAGDPDDRNKTVLGVEQKAWFQAELTSSADSHGLIVWVGSLPWIATGTPGADHWGGYTTEREELARFIRERGIDNLLMVSGDAHMLAIDDGSNNTYGGGGAGFPVFHAGALDKAGSVKGGPYSHGTFRGRGHFGLVHVEDDGAEITVTLTGRDTKDIVLLTHTFTVD